MTIRTTMKAGLTGLALVLSLGLVAGCSAISEIRDAIPNVDVDEDGGSVTIEGDNGESMTIDTDVDGEIPEWFPSELPLPEHHTVMSASVVESGDGTLKSVGVTSTDDFDAVVATIDDGFAGSGLTPETREVGDLGGMKSALFGVTIADESWMINIVDYGNEDGLQIMYATSADE